jgi:hypothetical protein
LCPSTSSHDADPIACTHCSRADPVQPEPLADAAALSWLLNRAVKADTLPYCCVMKNDVQESNFMPSALAASAAAWSMLTDEPLLPEHAATALAARMAAPAREGIERMIEIYPTVPPRR